ncbi:glutathione S-transferase family protein [Acidithiobacillus sp. MC6.1]|uniref:Glutathione S-transferase n=1 Tax=Acidithiobacillus ferrivorans TaxID=160808 RepID=A0A1B9C1B9_9PROT|nr:glutathione S-transferase family protein [Acidithiobacillus ferrivorans]MBN6741461.1 glutathione S-transferase family protein [Acidithiobacillus sp. MC6.1]OCB03766.1 glutathione S-transferase [Acidithiobacillus ferrivorans]
MPNDRLTFYTNPMSRGRIVRWMLEELGVPYQAVLLDYGTTMKAPEYLAINPMGKVPAIQHGQTVVTEAAAICAYLADAFPQMGLAPAPDDRLRGPYFRWLFFAAGPLEAAASNRAMGFVVPPEREKMMGYGTYAAVMDVLEDAVEQGKYLLGDNFSAVDVYVGAHLGFGMQFGTIERRPGFEHYWSLVSARPAAIRAKQIDDDLLPKDATKT